MECATREWLSQEGTIGVRCFLRIMNLISHICRSKIISIEVQMGQISLLILKTILELNIRLHLQMIKEISICHNLKLTCKNNILMEHRKFHIVGNFTQVMEEFQFQILIVRMDMELTMVLSNR